MTRFTNQFLLTTSGITGKEGERERERDRFTHSVGVDSHQSRGKEADEVCSAHLVLTLVVYHSERERQHTEPLIIQQSSLVLLLKSSQSLCYS